MKHSDYLKKKKTRETRKKIISVISAIVVFITTYALVLPAITLDVSRASREPGIAFEQMQFKATASAASVTAADSTVEEVQVEEPAAEEAAEEEIIKEEAAEIPEEETSAVSDENEKEEAEQVVEEAPAESAREEAPAAEAEEVQEEEDKSAEEKADAEPSSEPAQEEAQTAEAQKSADRAAVDQSGKSGTQATEAAAAASTEETAAEFQIPTLDSIDFDEILTGKTDFYFYHVEKTEEDENITSDSVDDWKKVGSDTVLAPEDFVRVYLSYEIPAGSLNETNAEARYRLPAGLELSDKQIKDINKYENGIAVSKSGREHDKYLGAEAIEGSRTPNEKAGDEYISATVKAEKVYKDGEYAGQDLIFTFIPYTVEKNQISYDEAGKLASEGRNVKGFFTFDLTTAQIDFEKTEKETVEKEDGTTEETQYSKAEVVFVKENNKKNIDEISRTLTLAAPVEKEEPQAKAQKTLVSKGEDDDYTVTVSYTDDAQIPDNAELAVREIEKGSDEYASYLEQAKGAVDENKSVNEARFFDITIMADGEKVEPQAPVNVQITFTGIEQTNTDDTQLLHYKDDKEVEVMDQAEFSKSEEPENETKAVDTVQFETDGFSVYGIVGMITADYLTADGETFTVTVNYGPEARIPANAVLKVSEVVTEEDGYTPYYDQTISAMQEESYVSSARLFDIKILVDGEEIEPEAPVEVKIGYKEPETLSAVNEVNILHFGKDKTEVLDAEVQGTENQLDGVTFTTGTFSVYAVVVLDNTEGSFEYAGQGYKVKVTYTAAAQFPAGTQMTIREIETDTEEYMQLLGEAWTKFNADYLLYKERVKKLKETWTEADTTPEPEPVPLKNIEGVRFFDITFTFDGKEIEPCAPVQVQIDLDDGMQLFEQYDAEVVHFGSAGTEIIDGVNARLDEDDSLVGVAYSQSSFSPIGIMSVGNIEDSTVSQEAKENRTFLERVAVSFKRLVSLFMPMTVHAAEGDEVISGKAINGSVKFYSDEACTNEITGAAPGTTVYIKATPNSGYYYSATTVTKVDGTPATDVTVERVGDTGNIYSFVMPGYAVLVTGVFQPPPEANKVLEPNGDGTYTLNLSVKGTAADLSAAASTSKKVNAIVVMDRSSSMLRNKVDIYKEYTESTYPVTEGPYYGLVNGEYVVLNRDNINNTWTYQVPVLTEYTGTRYVESTDNTSNKWVVSNGSLIEVTYTRRGNGNNRHWYEANSTSTTRYDNYTRYATNTTATSEVWGFVNGSMTSLSYSAEDSKYYYSTNTVAQTYNGKIYTLENVTRLEAEQLALDQMLDSLLSYNNPDIDGLEDVVEVEVISFATGRGDGTHNTSGYDPDTGGDTDGYSGITETSLTTNKETLMTAVNNDSNSTGTNWDEAMQYAKAQADSIHASQPDEDVYILFLTDGEPTTHEDDYIVGDTNQWGWTTIDYAAELQHALDPAKTIVDAAYTYPENYEDESLRGQPTNKKNYLYGVFTFGSGDGQNYLKQLVNYAYGYGTKTDLHTDDDNGYLQKYFFDAKDNASLISALDSFIAAVFSSLSYGNVSITDGVTIGGVNSVTSSTLVSGTAGGFEYTVKGPNLGVLYTVTATGSDDNPNVTFHVNGRAYTGLQKTKTIHITGDDPNTEAVETEYDQALTYWYFDETNYPNYKICLATVDDAGLVHWDLSGVGALQNGWTYNVGFTVWPDQDAYDYAAGLNNDLGGEYTWNTATQVDSGKGYFTDGTKYPYLVRYPGAGAAADDLKASTYAVLTNYEQALSYNVLSEVTTNGVTQYTYGEKATVDMATPPPMELTGSTLSVTKNWKDALDTSHLRELIEEAKAEGKTYGVTIEMYEGEELYKSYTFEPVYNDVSGEYEWPSQEISIAPALLVSELPEGTTTDAYKTVTFNNVTYYVLNEGHEYTLKETETDFHFQFSADPYHPALIDGVPTNVSFVVDEHDEIVDGSTATQVGDVPLETFMANNSLTAELDITKKIDDTIDALTEEQEDAETFTYKVTLTIPYDPEDPDKYTQYMNAYEFVPRYNDSASASNRYLIHGYQEDEDPSLSGLDDDVEYFNGKVHGRYTVSYPGGKATLDEIFTPDSGGTTQTGVIFVTLKRNEVLRFTNLPAGTTYSIQEIYANLRQADPSRDADAKPDVNTEASNIEAQGYTVSVATKNGRPTVSSTDTANDTVSGEITELNTRYYNQFKNTLSDATAVNLAVTKHLQGYEWNGERYYIRLSDASTISRFTDVDRYLTRESGSEDVTYTYASPLRFAEPGEYTFTFTEYDSEWTNVLSGTVSDDGITYGDAVTVKVTVGMVNGKLTITNVEGGAFTDSDEDGVNDLITATVTNKVIPLSIYKFGGSELSEIDNKLVGVQFKLYSDSALTQQVTQDARGNAIGTNGLITIGNDGTANLGVLSTGKYYLVETDLGENSGYNKLTDAVEIEIGNPIHYKQIGWSPSEQYSSASDASDLVKANGGMYINYAEDGTTFAGYTFTINNNTGYELPNTGGSGTLPYTLGGIALIMASALMYGFRMRRRERRFN